MIPVVGGMPHRSLRLFGSKIRLHGGGSKRLLRTLREFEKSEQIWSNIQEFKKNGLIDNLVLRCSGVVIKFTSEKSTEPSKTPTLENIVLNITSEITEEKKPNLRFRHGAGIYPGKLIATKTPYVHNLFKSHAQRFQINGGQLRFFRTQKGEKTEISSIKAKFFPTPVDQEKLLKSLIATDTKTSALLNDPNASKEEKDSAKLAFAEGYLSGSATPQRSKKTQSFFNVIQQILSIVALWLIILVVVTSSVIHLPGQNAVDPESISVTFDDVKGADDAKEELQEVVEFLRNPQKFSLVGGKLPKGVLLVGPPGTGKTLLARALAGEAGVPFFHTCGAEFDEMLVGQGARRVRDLFKTAKERAPCVIFIDEIDAVGCKRTNSVLHPHANQTVNQLLSEMDGFNSNQGVIVMGATNRRDDLDPALLRPGRFDLEVLVAGPDFQGRKDILILYLSKIRTSNDIDLDILARGTAGFTGADLENVVNQAAIRAAINNENCVNMAHLEAARDKLLMGPEIRSRQSDEESNLITAYHEAGHALVAYYTRDAQPVHKVTIIARGKSLGHTSFIPDKERFHITRSALLARLDTMMGGRAAEDIIFGTDFVTSGAANDLRNATKLATQMVKDWGMSAKAGLRTYPGERDEEHGHAAQDLIDAEIKHLVEASYKRARAILEAHAAEHKIIAEKLLEVETLDLEDMKKLINPK